MKIVITESQYKKILVESVTEFMSWIRKKRNQFKCKKRKKRSVGVGASIEV